MIADTVLYELGLLLKRTPSVGLIQVSFNYYADHTEATIVLVDNDPPPSFLVGKTQHAFVQNEHRSRPDRRDAEDLSGSSRADQHHRHSPLR